MLLRLERLGRTHMNMSARVASSVLPARPARPSPFPTWPRRAHTLSMRTLGGSFETFAVSIFTVEYGLRISTCPNLKAFLLSPHGRIEDADAKSPRYRWGGVRRNAE